MSASKQWTIERSELKREPLLGNKLYNATRFAELNEQLETVITEFDNKEIVFTAVRSIVEETTNIINFNDDWVVEPLKVRSEFSSKTIKLEIIYYGTTYWDPVLKETRTVIGSVEEFGEYSRSFEAKDNHVRIQIKIRIS